ncbi:MAG: hypothetical protein QOE68_4054, partial [Thermoanaerobaculia bacterium]|nr:hypothetical protein [Thermoanaerobaculia bacterium]
IPLDELKIGEKIPDVLFLGDGRAVPTCVVYAPVDEGPGREIRNLTFPSGLIGGGYSVVTDVQGSEHIGSLGCLASDGDMTYAITSRHVTGEPGRPIYSIIRGKRERIGVSDSVQVRHRPFSSVYPGWPGDRVFVTMDVGLVRIDDITNWTAQVYGIGELGDVADLNVDTISLDLMGCPVRAFGSVSGVLEGKVKGLFYRYRSKGGFDYVADVLIGPRRDGEVLATRPGDSGTLWVFDPPVEEIVADAEDDSFVVDSHDRGRMARKYRPLALQWGGAQFLGELKESPTQFALATFVSTASRVMEIDVVRSWNTGHPEYWGKIAHFKIGASAIDVIKRTLPPASKLRKLLVANRDLIGYDDASLGEGENFKVDRKQFVRLADVPDYVWIGIRSTNEPAQHFADMDLPGLGDFAGKTLADLCADEANVDAQVWKDYYDSFIAPHTPSPGVLPLRIWQLYREMVKAAGAGDADLFILAAGTLAHYAGDSSQPQHGTRLDHGVAPLGRETPEFKAYAKTPQYKIHGLYEERMFELHPAELLQAINGATKKLKAKAIAADTRNGFQAALATIGTMKKVRGILSPEDIIKADDPTLTERVRADNFFETFTDQTAKCVAQGVLLLANLWLTAWKEGKGDANMKTANLGIRDDTKLQKMYRNSKTLESLSLDGMIDAGLRAPV